MLKDITLGQFFPGNSLLHKADPRMKFILAIVFMVFVFIAKSASSYLLVLGFTLFLIIVSGIRLSVILKGLKPLLFIIAFTAVFNIFWTKGEGDPLFAYKIIKIYKEGLWFAAVMILRTACLMAGCSIMLTYTTPPVRLTDAIEKVFSPLKLIKVPVHNFAMTAQIALRFIPTIIEETDKVMSAQKARGADFASGGLIKRAKALLPVLIPLFASSIRRAIELATAMECRCYRGDNGRTRMKQMHFGLRDLLLFLIFAAFCAGVILMNIYLKEFLSFGIKL